MTKIIAVSGGVDSMYLLFEMMKGQDEIVVAHVNHGFREQSEEEYEMVKSVCLKNNIKMEYKKLNLEKKDENTAREARYEFLYEVARKYNSKEIYLAHHGDDLVETYLMNVFKGATREGLICMSESYESNDGIMLKRPLLNLSKKEIYKMAEQKEIPWMEDQSNQDEDAYKRNKVRHKILPIAKELNPSIIKAIKRITIEQKETEEYFENIINEELRKIPFNNGIYKLDKQTFLNQSKIIKKRLFKKLYKNITKEDSFKYDLFYEFENKLSSSEINTDFQEITKNLLLVNSKNYIYLMNNQKKNEAEENLLTKKEIKKAKNKNIPVAFRKRIKKINNEEYMDIFGDIYKLF